MILFIFTISLFGCVDNVDYPQKEMQTISSDSSYKIKGTKILDSIKPIVEFKLKSGSTLMAKDASSIYFADTNNLESLLNFSIALYKEKYFSQSNWYLNKLLEKDSNSKLEVYFQKGILWDNVPNNDSTLYYFNKSIEISPKTAMLYYYRSIVFANDSLFDKAIIDINQAIKLQPKNESLYIVRGTYKISLNDYEGALQDFKNVPPSMKNDYNIYGNRALVCYKLNYFEECIKQCDISISLNPSIAKIYTLRGAAKAILNRQDEALEDYKKASELGDPEGIKVYKQSLEWLKTHKQI